MNSIQKILEINNKELAANTPDAASWHADYADTSYLFVGNLDRVLKEKDILTIFSQYGNPTHINLVKDKDTGKLRGFCYLKYEDQRSCVLAVDNFNGTLIHERPLKVDHIYYKLARGQLEDDFKVEYPQVKVPEKIEPPRQSKAEEALDDDFEDPLANMVKMEPERKRHRGDKDRSDESGRHKSSRHSDRGERHSDRSERRSDRSERRSDRHRGDRIDRSLRSYADQMDLPKD